MADFTQLSDAQLAFVEAYVRYIMGTEEFVAHLDRAGYTKAYYALSLDELDGAYEHINKPEALRNQP